MEERRCTKYYVDYSGWGHPEWSFVTNEEGLRKLLEDIQRFNWVRPDIQCIEEQILLNGIITLDFDNKKVYVQWSEEENVDFARGEDLVFTLDDVDELIETFKNVCVKSVEVEGGKIKLYVTTYVTTPSF